MPYDRSGNHKASCDIQAFMHEVDPAGRLLHAHRLPSLKVVITPVTDHNQTHLPQSNETIMLQCSVKPGMIEQYFFCGAAKTDHPATNAAATSAEINALWLDFAAPKPLTALQS